VAVEVKAFLGDTALYVIFVVGLLLLTIGLATLCALEPLCALA
jgi:hypothetical protein